MGAIVKILGRVVFRDNPCKYMDMELNKGEIIHLQSNCWRLELNKQEFIEFVDSVCLAAKKLQTMKKKG